MKYNQLFKQLRASNGYTHDSLAEKAGCHRNTVLNVEYGRPTKFKSIAQLLAAMGYNRDSEELRSIALLWVEKVSGVLFSREQTLDKALNFVGKANTEKATELRALVSAIVKKDLTPEQIRQVIFIVGNPKFLAVAAEFQSAVKEEARTLRTP